MMKVENEQRTCLQVPHGEAVLDAVAGLSGTPTLQAGVFLLWGVQHVVTAQALQRGKNTTCVTVVKVVKSGPLCLCKPSLGSLCLLWVYATFSLLLNYYYLGVFGYFKLFFAFSVAVHVSDQKYS